MTVSPFDIVHTSISSLNEIRPDQDYYGDGSASGIHDAQVFENHQCKQVSQSTWSEICVPVYQEACRLLAVLLDSQMSLPGRRSDGGLTSTDVKVRRQFLSIFSRNIVTYEHSPEIMMGTCLALASLCANCPEVQDIIMSDSCVLDSQMEGSQTTNRDITTGRK